MLLARLGDERSFACYCVPVSLQLRGRLQMAAINRAVQKLVERHEALRTTIGNANEQCIWPFLKIEVLSIELQHLASCDRDRAVAEWFAQESLTPFNLSAGPLFRAYILKLEEELHLLTLVIHHLVADGLSMNIMLQELAALYSAECQGSGCPLAPPLQLCEYTQLQARQPEEMAAHESYLEQFTQQVSVLELPTDHPRPPINSFRGTRQTVQLNASLCRGLKRISQQRGCTLLMTLIAGYAILLHRITNQDDIALMIPTGGRTLAGGQQVIGNMRHLLPIHTDLVGNPTFSEYLARLKNILLDAYEHQDYSFAKAFNKLLASRDLYSSGAIAATFNLDRFVMPKMFGLDTEKFFSLPIGFIAFDISLNVIEIDDNLTCDLEYNLDLFSSTTICRWLEDFQTLLEGIVVNPLEQVHSLPRS